MSTVAGPARAPDRRGHPAGQLTAVVALTPLTGRPDRGGPARLGLLAGAGRPDLAARPPRVRRAAARVRSPMLPLPLLRLPTLAAGSLVGLPNNLASTASCAATACTCSRSGGTPLVRRRVAPMSAQAMRTLRWPRRWPRCRPVTGMCCCSSPGAAELSGGVAGAGSPVGTVRSGLPGPRTARRTGRYILTRDHNHNDMSSHPPPRCRTGCGPRQAGRRTIPRPPRP